MYFPEKPARGRASFHVFDIPPVSPAFCSAPSRSPVAPSPCFPRATEYCCGSRGRAGCHGGARRARAMSRRSAVYCIVGRQRTGRHRGGGASISQALCRGPWPRSAPLTGALKRALRHPPQPRAKCGRRHCGRHTGAQRCCRCRRDAPGGRAAASVAAADCPAFLQRRVRYLQRALPGPSFASWCCLAFASSALASASSWAHLLPVSPPVQPAAHQKRG